jgi:hypothetical protein
MHHHTTETATRPGVWTRVAARFFAVSCFFPYPALSIGGNNGLQLSHALALASVPLLCTRPPGRPFRAYLLLLTPLYLSMFANAVLGDVPKLDVLPKETVSLTLAMIALWPSELVARRDLFREVLAAATLAMLVHALIGLYQVYSFRNDEFPLIFLYKNPSFRSMEEWQQVYARYIKRPCGIFPEPSAMAASLGPWLVLATGLLLDPALGRGFGWRPGRGAAAVAGGFLLIALSRSGCTFAIMAAIMALCVNKFRHQLFSLRIGGLVTIALVLAAGAGVLWYAVSMLSSGLEERVASSWGLRGMSIQAGLTTNTEPLSMAFGVGPGQSAPIIKRVLAGVPRPDDEGDLAIYSLTVCFYMEAGVVGALAMLAVLATAVRAIARSSAVLLGFCVLGTWIVGVGVTTSYMALSAIWLCLGTLLCWDHLFPARAAAAAREFA